MNTRFSILAAVLAFLLAAPASVRAQAPNIITYQGRITNSGANFTGTGQFRFVIYRTGPITTHWSHDSSSANGSMPATAVSLPVTDGLFAVGLGDTTVPGMNVPIPAAIFANANLRVRIWFSDGVVAPAAIADHPITSVGYAFMAMTVPDGSITSGKLAAGAVGSAALANDVTFSLLRLDELGTETVTLDASTGAGLGALLTMRNGLGAATATLDSDTTGDRGALFTLFNSVGAGTVTLNSDGIGESATLALRNSANIETVQLLSSIGGGEGAILTLRNGLSGNTVILDADTAGRAGAISLLNASVRTTVLISGDQGSGIGGVIQVFNDAGALRAELDGQGASGGGELVLNDASGTATVSLRGAEATATGARLEMRQANGALTAVLDAEGSTGGGFFDLYKADGTRTVWADADFGGEGKISTQTLATRTLEIATGGSITLLDTDGTTTVSLLSAQTGTTGARMEMFQANGALTVILDGEVGTGGGGYLQLRNGAGTGTITLDSDSAGDGRITTQVLEITGGSDFSENFDIRSGDALPGMIVSIDAAHPGELAVSGRAYDRTVAGIVSGAGGVKPGLMMGQRGTVADGKYPVALTGRVYCLVDADRGAIEPGDLITTSDTPGHGMKVTDHARAQGAIIGKAMMPLGSGRGLVLVLVNLQ